MPVTRIRLIRARLRTHGGENELEFERLHANLIAQWSLTRVHGREKDAVSISLFRALKANLWALQPGCKAIYQFLVTKIYDLDRKLKYFIDARYFFNVKLHVDNLFFS